VREGGGGGGAGVVSVCVMKLVSWNVRGLGGFEKRREVSRLVREKQPFILCIQETKLAVLDDYVCKAMWGDVNVDFSFQPSVGASGGLAIIWDTNEVEVWSSMSLDHVLVVDGKFVKSGEHFVLFNVYAPCDVNRQEALWEKYGRCL
jgi:exonuclease III